MAKRKYQHHEVLITAKNMLAHLEQDALVHPYPRDMALAAEKAEMLRTIMPAISAPLKKNEILNAIARTPATTTGAAAMIPILRTPITAGNLDKYSKLTSIKDALGMCMTMLPNPDKGEEDRVRWMLRALEYLRVKDIKSVHFVGLATLSTIAKNYPLPGEMNE